MRSVETEDILGYPISNLSKSDCIELIVDWLEDSGSTRYFVCANPHSIQVAQTDESFNAALHSADLITPDGIGIVMASKLLGGGITDRVTGSDVFEGLTESLNKTGGKRYFFLGSTKEVLAQIKNKMSEGAPNVCVAGTYSPPFKPEFTREDNKAMVEAINAARPDVLWVGMTAPKQEKWIFQNRDKLDVTFIGAIGAVFDFYAGTIKRSHPRFQKYGLEWLPRLIQEPRRLWRRNFVSNPSFVYRILRTKAKQPRSA